MNQNNIKLSGVSLGYAYYDEKKMNIKDVIAQADEMMYKNKCGNMPNWRGGIINEKNYAESEKMFKN